MMVAMLLEDTLLEQSCIVVGPAHTVPEALQLANSAAIDVAVLDVNLNGTQSYPVADELLRRDVPFVFATGYGVGGMHAAYEHQIVLQKPFQERDLLAALEVALTRHADAKESGAR